MRTKSLLQRHRADAVPDRAGAMLQANHKPENAMAVTHSPAAAQRRLSDEITLSEQAKPLQAMRQMMQDSGSAKQLKSMQALMQQSSLQRVEDEELAQAKHKTLQRVEDEELAQGKFESTQRVEDEELAQVKHKTLQRVEDEELVQGKFTSAQLVEDEELAQAKHKTLQKVEDEELVQGKFESTQLAEDEELAQAKHKTLQRVEDEELVQGKFTSAQRVEDEEMTQAKHKTLQRVEDEELVQGKSSTLATSQMLSNTETVPTAKANNTGLPNQLKAGIESLSGMNMNHVKVNYNSDKPAQLNAHAYAQGSEIHVAPGQEQHLPHEAWHVVQQAQGRVKPTMQMKGGVEVNDDIGLETEADVMGAKAMSTGQLLQNSQTSSMEASQLIASGRAEAGFANSTTSTQLRKIGKFGMEAEVMGERFKMIALNDRPEADILRDPEIVLEEFSIGRLDDAIEVSLDNELMHKTNITQERSFTVEFVTDAVDAIEGETEDLEKMEAAWTRAGQFWKTNLSGSRKVIGMVGEAVDWFKQNKHWEAEQFNGYAGRRNISEGADSKRLFWDGPGFFTYIDARTEDPDVSMQMTVGSNLLALDAVRLATSHVMAGHDAPNAQQIQGALEKRDIFNVDGDPQAWAILKILADYRRQSQDVWLDQLTKQTSPKRYQKEYIAFMLRTSLSSVFDGISGTGQQAFIQWVRDYAADGTGPISDMLIGKHDDAFFMAESKKEPQANTITIAEVLVSIINHKLPEEERDAVKPGDAFSQVKVDETTAPLAGFGEIADGQQAQLNKYGLDSASEMMRGVTGVIAENRAAKTRKLSEVPGVFRQLVNALGIVESKL